MAHRDTVIVKFEGQLTPLNEVNNKNRSHWSIGAGIKKSETYLIQLQCGRMPVIDYPVTVAFEWLFSSKHDFDNIASCKKVVLDGIVQAGKLPDDSQKWVRGFSDSFRRVDKGSEGIIVALAPA